MSRLAFLALLLGCHAATPVHMPITPAPAPAPAPAQPSLTKGAWPGFWVPDMSSGYSLRAMAGDKEVTVAIAQKTDGSFEQLVWIDDAGEWHAIATLPRTFIQRDRGTCAPKPDEVCTTDGLVNGKSELHGWTVDQANYPRAPYLTAFANGAGAEDFYVHFLVRWDATLGNFVLDGPRFTMSGRPQPNSNA